MANPILQVRNLVKTYHVGDHVVRALRGADMDVQPGEFVGFGAEWPIGLRRDAIGTAQKIEVVDVG